MAKAVIVQWPQHMDSTLAEDMKDWLKIVSRKIQRAFDEDDAPDERLSAKEWAKKTQPATLTEMRDREPPSGSFFMF